MVANEPSPTGPRPNIVVGVDDSEGAAIALRWADAMVTDRKTRGLDTRAVAITAWRQPAFDFLGGLTDLDAMEEAASALLDRCLAKLPSTDNFETATGLGGPADVLLDEAERLDADLIVVGTRGRGGLAELLLGSVSRSVAARAQRPVAIVPATSTFSDGPIVVGYDGSPGGQAALAWAIDNEEGPILAVSAWHLPTDAIYEPGTVDVARFEAEIREELEAAIEALAKARPDRDVVARITPVVQRDDPRLTLVEASKTASHVVLGARANRGVQGILLGSTVDYVASRANQTVIVVPPPQEDGSDV